MSATGRQLNWKPVGFTPSGGSQQVFDGVTSVRIDPGGRLLKFYGDGDIMPTTIVNHENEPTASVEAADIALLQSFAPGTVGTFSATHKDAKNAVGGGIVYTLINAVVRNNPSSGQRGQWGTGTFDMDAFSSDGQTNPLSFTRV
jgi:hypothetical protein